MCTVVKVKHTHYTLNLLSPTFKLRETETEREREQKRAEEEHLQDGFPEPIRKERP